MSATPKIPLKILTKESGILFLSFLIGAVLISSLQDQDLNPKVLLIKFLILGALFVTIFSLNTCLFYYFDRKRKSEHEKIWKKTFFIGYMLSVGVTFFQHQVLHLLYHQGLLSHDLVAPTLKYEVVGWKLLIFVLYSTLILYTFVFLIQNFVINQYEKSRLKLELVEMEAANAEATNQLLHQQIQPHFLFNALNILKTLIRKDPKNAESYLLKLSNFLRVSISKNTSGVALLKEELKVSTDYMEMQKIRFGEALIFENNIEQRDDILNQKLPFFSIQPLLENAIKHNELTTDNPLYIRIEQKDEYIVVSNNLQPKKHNEISTGNGHSMLKKRYKMLSGDDLTIENDGQDYIVKLKILK